MKWFVYFDQVNQTRYEVEADEEELAVKKAERMWRQDYGWPSGVHVEKIKDGAA